MKKKHNGIISFWKFMFSILMIALHLGTLHPEAKYRFSAGSIGVEFFFIVSGFLFCKKYLNNPTIPKEELGKKNIEFFLSKIKRFIPYILFLLIISLPYTILIKKYAVFDFCTAFYNILYIPAKVGIIDIYGITWYLVVMIIIESIIFSFLNKYKENFIYIALPIIILISGNYLLIKYGNLAATWNKTTYFYGGIIRGLFSISIGMILYPISTKLKDLAITNFSAFILTIIEIIGYTSIFIIANKTNAHIRYDYIMVLILSICIIISFSGQSLMNEICNNKLFYYLEKISLPIYINQWFLIRLINYLITNYYHIISYYKELLITIIVSLILAIIEIKIINIYKKNKNIIFKLFIKV